MTSVKLQSFVSSKNKPAWPRKQLLGMIFPLCAVFFAHASCSLAERNRLLFDSCLSLPFGSLSISTFFYPFSTFTGDFLPQTLMMALLQLGYTFLMQIGKLPFLHVVFPISDLSWILARSKAATKMLFNM